MKNTADIITDCNLLVQGDAHVTGYPLDDASFLASIDNFFLDLAGELPIFDL